MRYHMDMCGTADRDGGCESTSPRHCAGTYGKSSTEIRTQLMTFELPEAPNDARCEECQLLHHCLPELSSEPRRVDRYMENVVFRCAT